MTDPKPYDPGNAPTYPDPGPAPRPDPGDAGD